MASGNALPKSKGDGIIDLSSDADWEARLAEARERRAKVLAEGGVSKPVSRPRIMPWEETGEVPAESDLDGDSVDFHDRMNRFKSLAGVKAPRERTKAEKDHIDALLDGSETSPIRTMSSAQELADKEPVPEPASGMTPTGMILSEARTMSLDPADAAELQEAAQSLYANDGGKDTRTRPTRSIWRLFGRSALVMVLGFIAGSTYVTFAGAFGLPTF